MPFKLRNDNTRVLKPLIVTPIERKLVRRTKNEEVRQDNRPLILRHQALAESSRLYNKLKMDNAKAFTGQAFANMSNLVMPSHLIGVLTSDKPWQETVGNPQVQATSNDFANFILDMTSPTDYLKAMAVFPAFIKDFKTVNELKDLLTGPGYKFMSLSRKDLNGLSVFDYYNKNGSLSLLYLSKFKEYMKIAREGLKGKKGVNVGLNAIKDAEKAKTAEGQLELIRRKYLKLVNEVNNASLKGILKLDWWDTNNTNLLARMPDWLKAQRVGFNERPFLDRYLSNVISKVGPKLKELLDKGWLRPTADGKHWEGLVKGNYIKVDPYRYIISHLDRAQAYGNKVNVLPESIANIPRHGTSGRKGIGWLAKHMTNPSLEFDQTLYTIISDGRKGANDGIDYFSRNNGASVPLLEKPNLEPGNYRGGRTGNSNSSGVANGAAGEKIEVHRDVSDPLVGGSAMDEYNFGPGIDNIKSYWNTLDFEYGAGPLAMINSKLDKLLA